MTNHLSDRVGGKNGYFAIATWLLACIMALAILIV